jgi:hypothetical protein
VGLDEGSRRRERLPETPAPAPADPRIARVDNPTHGDRVVDETRAMPARVTRQVVFTPADETGRPAPPTPFRSRPSRQRLLAGLGALGVIAGATSNLVWAPSPPVDAPRALAPPTDDFRTTEKHCSWTSGPRGQRPGDSTARTGCRNRPSASWPAARSDWSAGAGPKAVAIMGQAASISVPGAPDRPSTGRAAPSCPPCPPRSAGASR